MIAALYVETNGVYFGLPDVDPWDARRDARLYAGPWPVVAHPPCERWGRHWSGGPSALRNAIIARDGMVCGICGEDVPSRAELHIDHIKPVSRGGRTVPGNLRVTHAICNMRKGARYKEGA